MFNRYSFVGMGMCISKTETITEKRKKEKETRAFACRRITEPLREG